MASSAAPHRPGAVFVREGRTGSGFEFDDLAPPLWAGLNGAPAAAAPALSDDALLWSQCFARSLVRHPSAPQLLCVLFNQASRHLGCAFWQLPYLIAAMPGTAAQYALVSRLYVQEPLTGEWAPLALVANQPLHAAAVARAHPDLDPWHALRRADGRPHGPVAPVLLDFLSLFYIPDLVNRLGLAAAIDKLADRKP
jgi:hypothetical protein